jgi:uncharacterized protein (TIGR03083 family)
VSEPAPSFDDIRTALRHSHERLGRLVELLADDEVTGPSYDTEWSVAQVLSHLGSGAEIFGMFIDAGLGNRPAPGPDDFPPIWRRWNDKDPSTQANDAVRANADFVHRIEAIASATAADWQLSMFGTDRRLNEVLRMRLAELAVHSWDIAVIGDPSSTVDADAVAVVIDDIGQIAARAGKPPAQPFDVLVQTTDPTRSFLLRSTADGIELAPLDPAAGTDGTLSGSSSARLILPGEALIRLVYGRLGERHTPALEADGVDLDDLRAAFPGV